MDKELKQHLDATETRITALLNDLKNGISCRLNAGFDNMHRRFDALEARLDVQDQLLDRQDIVLDRWVRAMEAHIERMDKREASRTS